MLPSSNIRHDISGLQTWDGRARCEQTQYAVPIWAWKEAERYIALVDRTVSCGLETVGISRLAQSMVEIITNDCCRRQSFTTAHSSSLKQNTA